jgi:hypothetical protein
VELVTQELADHQQHQEQQIQAAVAVVQVELEMLVTEVLDWLLLKLLEHTQPQQQQVLQHA